MSGTSCRVKKSVFNEDKRGVQHALETLATRLIYMKLDNDAISAFARDGVLVFPELFDVAETNLIAAAIEPTIRRSDVRQVMEGDGVTLRSVFELHATSEAGSALARCSRMLGIARNLLSDGLYVYQSKYNAKAAFDGDVWEWHQDFPTWHVEDGTPNDDLVTAMLFLDDTTEHNAPLLVMPGSHRGGMFVSLTPHDPPGRSATQPWLGTHTASLKYKIPRDTLRATADAYGIRSITGAPGTVCFFHCSLVHASTTNITPYERRSIFFTYNRVKNSPPKRADGRPAFIAARSDVPLEPISDDALHAAIGLLAHAGSTTAVSTQ
jgi:ectoine hydroxylase